MFKKHVFKSRIVSSRTRSIEVAEIYMKIITLHNGCMGQYSWYALYVGNMDRKFEKKFVLLALNCN